MDSLVKMIEELGLPFAYDHFAEGESPEPPFVCYLLPGSRNFAADGRVYYKGSEVRLEVYTDRKDLGLEARCWTGKGFFTISRRYGSRARGFMRSYTVLDGRLVDMANKKNKVKFNLKNAHYAMLSVSEEGEISYGTPVSMPGSVSISLDANGEPENFYADGVAYYVINNNMGYDGDLELAMIPESFRTDALGERLDDKGVLIENAEVELSSFALLFEFDGDQRHIRHVLYNCSASRPGIEGKTNEESREVQTETLTIKATPLPGGMVKAKTGDTTDAAVYNGWYAAVYMPAAAPENGNGEDETV